ncbi:hypothetical protein ONZ45_g12147 [Pleurotus djamor]|nr:hypothetical protein ONZ45_g12147 [Pleurotus djamor]
MCSANLAYVSIALPSISRDLSIPIGELQWVMSAYALTSGCFLLMIGRIADLYGRKLVFMTKMEMIVLRAIQGIGAAATIPAALGILAQAFPPSKARAIAFTTFSTGNPLGGGLGMVLGGALTELSSATWRSSFFVFAGIASCCLIGGVFTIDSDIPSTEKGGRVDWIGAALVTTGLTLVTFVLSEGELAEDKWATPYIIVLMIFGVIFMVVFFFWQARLERIQDDPTYPRSWLTPPPIMKVSLWTRAKGRIAAVMWIAALTFCVFRSWQYWVQLYYQDYQRLSPVQTMVRVLPMFIAGVLCNFLVAQVVGRVPIVYIVVLGASVTSTASLLFAVINPATTYWAFGFPAAVFSVWGADFVFSSGTLFVAKTVAPHEQSLAGALMQTMTQLGTTLGVPVTTIVFNRVVEQKSRAMRWRLNSTGSNAPRPALLEGYKAAQWCAFGFGALAVLLALISLPGVGIVGHRAAPQPAPAQSDPNNSEKEKKSDLVSSDPSDERVYDDKGIQVSVAWDVESGYGVVTTGNTSSKALMVDLDGPPKLKLSEDVVPPYGREITRLVDFGEQNGSRVVSVILMPTGEDGGRDDGSEASSLHGVDSDLGGHVTDGSSRPPLAV